METASIAGMSKDRHDTGTKSDEATTDDSTAGEPRHDRHLRVTNIRLSGQDAPGLGVAAIPPFAGTAGAQPDPAGQWPAQPARAVAADRRRRGTGRTPVARHGPAAIAVSLR